MKKAWIVVSGIIGLGLLIALAGSSPSKTTDTGSRTESSVAASEPSIRESSPTKSAQSNSISSSSSQPAPTSVAPAIEKPETTSTTNSTPSNSNNVSAPQPIQPSSGLSNDNFYKNSQGNTVHSPAYSTNSQVPAGATAQCGDGTYSFSQSRRGTCSHHGGVAQWF